MQLFHVLNEISSKRINEMPYLTSKISYILYKVSYKSIMISVMSGKISYMFQQMFNIVRYCLYVRYANKNKIFYIS